MGKPIQVRPVLYTMFYENLKIIAAQHGYNLILHGSVHRDLDLVAVPWINDPKPELDMIKEFDKYFSGRCMGKKEDYQWGILPGGRSSYVINLNRGDKKGEWSGFDEQYYLDISITPIFDYGANRLLDQLAEKGGKIVSTGNLSVEEIELARAEKRLYVDSNCLGYVWIKCQHEKAINDYAADQRWCPDCGYHNEPLLKKQ